MQNIHSSEDLRKRIEILENQQEQKALSLKDHFNQTYEIIKPGNILKNVFKLVTSSFSLDKNILVTLTGIGAGYLSKKIVIGTSHNPIKKILGNMVLVGITNTVAEHPEKVKTAGRVVLRLIGKLIGAKRNENSL